MPEDSDSKNSKQENREVVIGSWASYCDTGIWNILDGQVVAPDSLTIAQLKDHLLICGGAVYLREDGKLCWFNKGMVAERSVDV
jgi:hypothetical protein